MPPQPAFSEMREEEEEDVRKATASPAAGQPQGSAQAGGSLVEIPTAPAPVFVVSGSSRRRCEEEVRLHCFLRK